METISISSDAFEDNGNIPVKYTCDGQDISPPLQWDNIPADTRSIALIMDDPDAPGGTWVHWVIYNIPANSSGLPPGVPGSRSLEDGTLQGKNDFGSVGYGGPCPPSGKPHRYIFKVYALDTQLDPGSGITKSQLETAIQGHILGKGELVGKYER